MISQSDNPTLKLLENQDFNYPIKYRYAELSDYSKLQL